MPLTAKEKMHRYRERLKNEMPEKYEEQRKKNLARIKSKKKKIAEMTQAEAESKRKEWREEKRISRQDSTAKAKKNSLKADKAKRSLALNQKAASPNKGLKLACTKCNADFKEDTRVYKCVQCVDMLLCAACETDEIHQQHCVMRFPSTRIYSKMSGLFESLQRDFDMNCSDDECAGISNKSYDSQATLTDTEFKDGHKVYMPINSVKAGPSAHNGPPSHIKATTEVTATTPDKKHIESMECCDESPVILPKIEPESDPEPDPLELRDNIQTSVRPSLQLPASTTFVTKTKRQLDELHEEIMIKEETEDCVYMLEDNTDFEVYTKSSPSPLPQVCETTSSHKQHLSTINTYRSP